jgi:sugar phosphate isomerase/epimerase/sugar lactone lactonase YvrE
MRKTFILLLLLSTSVLLAQGIDKSLTVFDFEFDDMPVPERTKLLTEKGFAGLTFGIGNQKDLQKFKDYLKTDEVKSGKINIPIVYIPYAFGRKDILDPIWKEALTLNNNMPLWVILTNRDGKATKEKALKLFDDMTNEAAKNKSDIVIYPHDNTLIECIDDALPYIETLKKDNLKLTLHLSHEMRAGKTNQLLKVALRAAPYLTFASLSGSDVTMRPNADADWSDAIKPLDEGDFNVEEFVLLLQKIKFKGQTVLHTFGIKKDKSHLDRSIKIWNDMVAKTYKDLNEKTDLILDNPENAYWDKASKSWYISSLGGEEVTIAKDGYGWITKIDENGNIVSNRWIENLDAPTGMASYKNFLYVADRGVLVKIDTNKGEVVKKIELPESRFANDVAASSNGDLYVSDTYTNTIYKVNQKDDVEIFFHSNDLENPNGLWVEDNNTLLVATWGPMTNEATFETSRKGRLLKLNMTTKKITPITQNPVGNFDGVVKYKDNYYATDWTGGRLLRISEDGQITEIAKGFNQFADLGIDLEKGIIMIPEMSKNRFITINLN